MILPLQHPSLHTTLNICTTFTMRYCWGSLFNSQYVYSCENLEKMRVKRWKKMK